MLVNQPMKTQINILYISKLISTKGHAIHNIDISYCSAGIYYLKFILRDRVIVKKVLINAQHFSTVLSSATVDGNALVLVDEIGMYDNAGLGNEICVGNKQKQKS